jgi:hypothetical protein
LPRNAQFSNSENSTFTADDDWDSSAEDNPGPVSLAVCVEVSDVVGKVVNSVVVSVELKVTVCVSSSLSPVPLITKLMINIMIITKIKAMIPISLLLFFFIDIASKTSFIKSTT